MNPHPKSPILLGISQEMFQRMALTAAGILLSAAVKFLGDIASDIRDMKTQLAVIGSTEDSNGKRISLLEDAVFENGKK